HVNLFASPNVGGRMRRIQSALLIAMFGASSLAVAGTPKKAPPPAKKDGAKDAKDAKATPPPAPPKKKALTPPPMVSAEHKKSLLEKFAGFKFGMSKDEILKVLQKQIDDRFEEKIKATTDIAMQDRYRKEKKAELSRVSSTYVDFGAGTTPWDVSIIEGEF